MLCLWMESACWCPGLGADQPDLLGQGAGLLLDTGEALAQLVAVVGVAVLQRGGGGGGEGREGGGGEAGGLGAVAQVVPAQLLRQTRVRSCTRTFINLLQV